MTLTVEQNIRATLYLKDGRVISGITNASFFTSDSDSYLMGDETDGTLTIGVPRRNVAYYNFRNIESDVAPEQPAPEEPTYNTLPGDSE